MARYKVITRFVFEGEFSVEADSRQEAKKIILEDCGLVLGGNIHTNLDDDDVDWDFNMHPTMQIGHIVLDK